MIKWVIRVNPTQPVGQGLPTLTNDTSPARTSPARTAARVVQQGQRYTSLNRENSHTCYRFHLRRTDVIRTQRLLLLKTVNQISDLVSTNGYWGI
jgi:hypothetical protein